MRIASLLLIGTCLAGVAQTPTHRELLGKLVKGDDQSQAPVDDVSVILDETGSRDVTRDGGRFRLFLPDALQPGVEITITVTVPGYAIYDPPGGKLILPADLLHLTEIRLLPKGSPKFLSDAQLRALVARTAKEASRQPATPNQKDTPDLSRYLKDWAVEYGFSVDQVQAEVNRWASEVQARKSSSDPLVKSWSYDLILAAFAKKNFNLAHDMAMDAASGEEAKLKALQEQQENTVDRAIRDYRLAGDSAFYALDFAKASDAYRKALSHSSKQQNPLQWADLKESLGNSERALISRSEGPEIAKHEDSAREAFSAALTVYTREEFPDGWATTQNDVGTALGDQASRSEAPQAADYLQQAVKAYSNALEVHTAERSPWAWATTENNLGAALDELAVRAEGQQATQYLQQSVNAYHDALQVRSRERFPEDWAVTQINLCGTFQHLADRSESTQAAQYLQQALEACYSALEVYTREQRPERWATTQNNLGSTLSNLAGHSLGPQRTQYLRQAVDAYRNALQVRTREQQPQDWASTQINLGAALRQLADDGAAPPQATEYLHEAVDAYDKALEVLTREDLPQGWATIQNNRGNALMELGLRSLGPQTPKYLQQAANAYRNALQVRTREQLPEDWAMTQNNLGFALQHLARFSGGPPAAQYLQQSVEAYQRALQVRTVQDLPGPWEQTMKNLGSAYEDQGDWMDARRIYDPLLRHDPNDPALQSKVKELSDKP